MRDRLRERLGAVRYRLRRLERREVHAFRRWLERTENLVHLSILLVLPVLIGVVTLLSNAVDDLSFLLFPPLAAGAYTLFANPEGRYASPTRFVGGLLVGALAGWLAVVVAADVLGVAAEGPLAVSAPGAALSVFLTAAVTWALDVEEPAAFSTALLALLVPRATMPAFVASVAVSTVIVAGVFALWREHFYEQRAEILYESTKGDDHVLVPMIGPTADATAMLGGRLAAAHDAGKVVLLDVVADRDVAAAELAELDRGEPLDDAAADAPAAEDRRDGATVDERAAHLEQRATTIEAATGVPCQVIVAVGGDDRAATVRRAARRANCDLIAAPYETKYGLLAPHLRTLFASEFDVLVHRGTDAERTEWNRVLVPVRGASDVAHSMVDFALRLVGEDGQVAVSHCVGQSGDHRRAEAMLANVVDPFDGPIETRVSRRSIEDHLADAAHEYDLILLGASRDRSKASRLISPPTFERIDDLGTDVAVVDRH